MEHLNIFRAESIIRGLLLTNTLAYGRTMLLTGVKRFILEVQEFSLFNRACIHKLILTCDHFSRQGGLNYLKVTLKVTVTFVVRHAAQDIGLKKFLSSLEYTKLCA